MKQTLLTDIQQAALIYLDAGLSVLPADLISKGPYKLLPWKEYTVEKVSPDLALKWFAHSDAMIGLICGAVSRMTEIIDIDNHFSDAETIFSNFRELVENAAPGLWDRLVIESTQSGGYHLIYKASEQIEGPQKLARRPKEDGLPDVLIETRGEGAYALVYPSDNYNLIQGKISRLQTLTSEERELLLTAARSFNEYIEPAAYSEVTEADHTMVSEAFEGEIKPGDDFNDRGNIRGTLESHGWTLVRVCGEVEHWRRPGKTRGISATFNSPTLKNKNKFYVFSSSAAPFEDRRSYAPFAVETLLNYNGDYAACARALIAAGFGKLKKNGVGTSKKSKADMKSIKSVNSDGALVDESIQFDFPNNCRFWFEYETVKGEIKLNISKANLINFLEHHGYFKYWIDENISIYVREINHIVYEETPETILDFLKVEVAKLPYHVSENKTRLDLWETILQRISTVNAKDYLSTLSPKNIDFLEDDRENAYFCFKNIVVEVNREEISLIHYSDIHKYIWKNQIIDHDIQMIPYESGADSSSCFFGRFLEKVCSSKNPEAPDDRSKRKVDSERLLSLLTGIGYLLHTYKDPAITKAVIFCEERIAKDEESNGRTGKGLTAYAISKLRKRVLFNGKQLDFRDKFLFQKVKPDTQLIYFDDVKKSFDFEALFSILTEGISIEKKGQQPIEIPFSRSPKVLISTNAVLSNDADSHKARKHEIEFSDFFTADYTPVDEFKGNFFEKGWSPDDPEWDRFYSFMIYITQLFLVKGLASYNEINLAERKLMSNVSEEFLEFSEIYVDKIMDGGRVYKEDIYSSFIDAYKIFGPSGRYAVGQKITTRWFNYILKSKKIDFVETRGSNRTDRRYYWCLRKNEVDLF